MHFWEQQCPTVRLCFPSLWQKEDVRQEYKVSKLPLELCSIFQAHVWRSYTFSSRNRSWSALTGEQDQSFLQIQRTPVHISLIHRTDLDSLKELPLGLSSSRHTMSKGNNLYLSLPSFVHAMWGKATLRLDFMGFLLSWLVLLKKIPTKQDSREVFELIFFSLVAILLLLGSMSGVEIQYVLNSQAALSGRKQLRPAPMHRMCTPWCPEDSFSDFFFCPPFFLLFTKSETLKDIVVSVTHGKQWDSAG